MKKKLNSSYLLVIAVALMLVTSCRRDVADVHDTYTCPMHPTVISDRPGTCPVCGMDLVRKAREGEELTIDGELARLAKSPNAQVLAKVKTIKGIFRSEPARLQVPGIVTYDTKKLYAIPSRVAGRLEKVYVRFPFQQITRGQKVAEIYSAELVAAQRELLFVIDKGDKGLAEKSREKLRLLGMDDRDIDRLVNMKDVQLTVAIYSPYSGYVVATKESASAENEVQPATAAAADNMNEGMTSPAGAAQQQPQAMDKTDLKSAGSYVASGEVLFTLADPSSIRVELKLASNATVKRGDTVLIHLAHGRTLSDQVDVVQPFFSDGEQFSSARIELKNSSGLRIGEQVSAELRQKPVESLWIPSPAVFDSGLERVVFIKEGPVFRPRVVTTGVRTGDQVQIVSGLSSSEEIAADAHFLVDSESLITHE